MGDKTRWSDDRLELFYEAFMEHTNKEELERERDKEKQDQIHDALFRKEDAEENVAPGVIQLLMQVSTRPKSMEIAADRQKTFIGGVVFSITAAGFFLTESAHKLMIWVRSI